MSLFRPRFTKTFTNITSQIFSKNKSFQSSFNINNTLFSSSYRSFSHCVGIDLGTTNSAVAIFENNKPKIIANVEGHRTTPSMVAFKTEGEDVSRLVGIAAKRQAVTNPNNTFYATKRLIGRRFDEQATTDIAKNLSYKVVSGDNGDSWVYCPLTDKKYSPSQIGSFVLQNMKETAEAYLEAPVTEAVITVPAYFNEQQRRATKDAGVIAGLDVRRVINEPTAAAMAYGMGDGGPDSKRNGLVAVYDMGGGTFDISILSLDEGVFEVRATNGDTQLGGEDFDHVVLEYIAKTFQQEVGIDLTTDPLAMQRLKDAAETSRKELDKTSTTTISLPFITSDSSGAKHLEMEFSRDKFESLCSGLLERSLAPCELALKDSEITKDKLSDVILVGGMTRMPKIQEEVEKFFGRTASKTVNPDEVVAMGAAIQGGVLQGKTSDIVLVDVTPLSLGIETLGGIFTKLIEKNTAIPCKKTETFSTASDNQTQVGIKVFQGEREMATDNKFLGNFDLVGIPPAPRGRPQIEVGFDISADGILNVSAKDKGTNKDCSMKIDPSGGLSKDEIERMRNEAERMASEDKIKRELAEQKNTADTLVFQAESQIDEFEEKISEEIKNEIETQMEFVQQLRSNDNTSLEELKEGCDKLNKALQKIGESIYGTKTEGTSESTGSDNQGSGENEQEGEKKF